MLRKVQESDERRWTVKRAGEVVREERGQEKALGEGGGKRRREAVQCWKEEGWNR
jgi:hypothetical protein